MQDLAGGQLARGRHLTSAPAKQHSSRVGDRMTACIFGLFMLIESDRVDG